MSFGLSSGPFIRGGNPTKLLKLIACTGLSGMGSPQGVRKSEWRKKAINCRTRRSFALRWLYPVYDEWLPTIEDGEKVTGCRLT